VTHRKRQTGTTTPVQRAGGGTGSIGEPTEGQVTDDKNDQIAEGMEPYRKQAELLNGTKMPYGEALAAWEILRDMQENAPEEFKALVALVKNKAADINPKMRAILRKNWTIRKDGSITPDLAAVLEAAYDEQAGPDHPVLRYPIVHSDSAELADLQRLEQGKTERVLRDLLGGSDPEGRSR
jgi:transcription termination factor NusB